MKAAQEKIRVLLVEDEKKLSHSIERQLERAGYNVDCAFDGIAASEHAATREYELIILDLNIPGKSGLDVLTDLRRDSYPTPVLILSARDKTEDRILGLQSGADDYLVKPFDSGELLARVEAILRRSGHSRVAILQAADVTLDVVQRKVTRGGKEVALTPREFSLLEYLLRNKNHVLTRKRIAEQVWGYAFDTGTNIVDVYIAYLRKALGDSGQRKLIQTAPGEGFTIADE